MIQSSTDLWVNLAVCGTMLLIACVGLIVIEIRKRK